MTPTRRPHARHLKVAGAAAACALLLAGCGSGTDGARSGGADASTRLSDSAAVNGAVAAGDADAPVEVVGGNEEAGGPGFDHSNHGHDPMMGMLSHDDLHTLQDASGAEFDRLFLAGMLAHHEGAVGMAQTVAQTGVDDDVSALAAAVIGEQSAEMDAIRALQG